MLSAFKNFFVTFLLSALVFGACAYFATGFLATTITGIFDSEAGELEEILHPTTDTGGMVTEPVIPNPGTTVPSDEVEGTSFNMLFIVTDYQPEMYRDYLPAGDELTKLETKEDQTGILSTPYRRPRACAVLLMRADKEKREFTLTSFPSNMQIQTPSGPQSMADLYNLYGRDHIVSQVASMTGLDVDHYLMVNVTELYQIIAELGGISMDIPKPLYYNGQISTTIKPTEEERDILPMLYPIGMTDVDGAGSVAILTNEEYLDGVEYRNTLVTDFFSALMKKLLNRSQADLTSFYDTICSKAWVETTFTTKDLVAQSELVFAYIREDFTVKVLPYPGKFVSKTETSPAYFSPDITAGLSAFKAYRPYLTGNSPT